MGLIIKELSKRIQKTVSPLTDKVLTGWDKVVEAVDLKTQQRLKKFMEQGEKHTRYWLEDLRVDGKNSFDLKNERGDRKFQVLRGARKGKTVYTVHSLVGRELACLVEQKPFLDKVLRVEDAAVTYELYDGEYKIGEAVVGMVEARRVTLKANGLSLGGKSSDMQFWVQDDQGEILMVAGPYKEYLCLEIAQPAKEMACVLIALAVNLAARVKAGEGIS